MQLKNLERAVLAKLKPDFSRKEVRPGVYEVDFCVHVAGDVEVCKDQKVTPTVELSVYGVLVTALLESGVKQDQVLRVIERVAARALAKRQSFNEQLTTRAQELVEKIRERWAKKMKKVKRAGAIKLDVEVERVG